MKEEGDRRVIEMLKHLEMMLNISLFHGDQWQVIVANMSLYFCYCKYEQLAPKTVFMTSSTRACHIFIISNEIKIWPADDVHAGGVTDKNSLRMEHINHLKGVQSSSQQWFWYKLYFKAVLFIEHRTVLCFVVRIILYIINSYWNSKSKKDKTMRPPS